jgi:hypothetical protein
MDERAAQAFALRIAPSAAAVANFCDHVEHNEVADRAWVLDTAAHLRAAVTELCATYALSFTDLYAERLGAIEARNVLGAPGTFDGHNAALQARTWRDLQVVQASHDRHYHPDVIGLAKLEQLRHYALHLAKIVGAFAQPEDAADLIHRRLPDTALFGIKLSTVMGVRLADEPLPKAAQAAAGNNAPGVANPASGRFVTPHLGG